MQTSTSFKKSSFGEVSRTNIMMWEIVSQVMSRHHSNLSGYAMPNISTWSHFDQQKKQRGLLQRPGVH